MKRIALTIIIVVVFVIAGFFLTETFSSSSEPVALSNEAMGELIGGCPIGDVSGCNNSQGQIYNPSGSFINCSPSPCPSGSNTYVFGRIACDPCSRGKWKLCAECGYVQVVTRCVYDQYQGTCNRTYDYQGSRYSCDWGNGQTCT